MTREQHRLAAPQRMRVQYAYAHIKSLIANKFYFDEVEGCLARDIPAPREQTIHGLPAHNVIDPLQAAMRAVSSTIRVVEEFCARGTVYE